MEISKECPEMRNENKFVPIHVVVHFRTLQSLKLDPPIYLMAGEASPYYVESLSRKTDLICSPRIPISLSLAEDFY